MKYISQEDLMSEMKLASDLRTDLYAASIARLIRLCKELPTQQWQTLEEFKANPADGWYWISYDNAVYMSYYKLNLFFENDHAVDSSIFESDCITHVMPIKTPEAPK